MTNEKYKGDALLQKTITIDTLNKKRIKNNGTESQYYVEGSHEPIISKEVFAKVGAGMQRRKTKEVAGRSRNYCGKYALSGSVYCGHCGDIFCRISWNNRGYKSVVWRCISRLEKDGPACRARTVREEDIQASVFTAVNDAFANRERVTTGLLECIASVMDAGTEEKLKSLEGKLKETQRSLLEDSDKDA